MTEPHLIQFVWHSSYGPDGPHKDHVITALYSDGTTVKREYVGMSCADVRKRLDGVRP